MSDEMRRLRRDVNAKLEQLLDRMGMLEERYGILTDGVENTASRLTDTVQATATRVENATRSMEVRMEAMALRTETHAQAHARLIENRLDHAVRVVQAATREHGFRIGRIADIVDRLRDRVDGLEDPGAANDEEEADE